MTQRTLAKLRAPAPETGDIDYIQMLVPKTAVVYRTAPFPVDGWPLNPLRYLPSFIAIEKDGVPGKCSKGNA